MLVAPDHSGPAFWLNGFGSWGSTDSAGNAVSLDRNTGGLLIGADGMVGDWRIGLLFGYSHSSFKARDRASSGSSDNYHLGLYGGKQWGLSPCAPVPPTPSMTSTRHAGLPSPALPKT